MDDFRRRVLYRPKRRNYAERFLVALTEDTARKSGCVSSPVRRSLLSHSPFGKITGSSVANAYNCSCVFSPDNWRLPGVRPTKETRQTSVCRSKRHSLTLITGQIEPTDVCRTLLHRRSEDARDCRTWLVGRTVDGTRPNKTYDPNELRMASNIRAEEENKIRQSSYDRNRSRSGLSDSSIMRSIVIIRSDYL